MRIRPIKTEADHKEALREIEKRWNAAPGSRASDELDVWVTLVEAYERTHHAIALPDPVAAIAFRMEQMSLTRKDLEPFIGSRARVAEVMNRRRRLSLAMIRRLHDDLGVPAEVLIQDTRTKAARRRKRRTTPRAA